MPPYTAGLYHRCSRSDVLRELCDSGPVQRHPLAWSIRILRGEHSLVLQF